MVAQRTMTPTQNQLAATASVPEYEQLFQMLSDSQSVAGSVTKLDALG